MQITSLFTVQGFTKGKRYKVVKIENLSKIWARRFLIPNDYGELVWCCDDEVEEVV